MSTTVSRLKITDKQQWQDLFLAYGEFYGMPMDQTILDNVWGWIFDEGRPFYAFLAKDQSGQAVGFMHYRAMPSPLRGKEVGFLDDLFVNPNCRGGGVVEALFAALKGAATNHGWPFVRWMTADNNYRGRSVYDKIAQKTPWLTYQMAVD